MSRRKKILICTLLSLVVVMTIGYFGINVVLDRVSRRAMTQLVGLARRQGVEVVDPSFQSVRLSGIIAANWSNLRAGLKLPRGEAVVSNRRWDSLADQLSVAWSVSGEATLRVDRVVVTGAPLNQEAEGNDDSRVPAERRLELEDVQCRFAMELFDPEATVRRLLPEFVRLISTGETALPLQLTGRVLFSLKGEPAEVRLEVSQKDDAYAILLSREDVMPLSDRFEEKLTEAEVEIIADFPLRTIRLLEIKDRAESTSERAHVRDDRVPRDAYRHVLWSFLLAEAYGEDFAQQVGDAHETGDTGNTESEREMDLHNNAIGRKYAADKIAQKELLSHLLADSDVRRQP